MPPQQPLQQDQPDYQFHPAITFVGATQENRKHPAELKPGDELVKLSMWMGERDPAPTWPWPTDQLSWGTTLHGLSPAFYDFSLGGVPYQSRALGIGQAMYDDSIGTINWYENIGGADYGCWRCADWFEVGAYLVLLYPTALMGSSVGQMVAVNTFSWTSPGIIATTDFPAPADETNIHYLRQPYTLPWTAFDVYYDVQTTILISGTWGVGGAVTISYTNRYYTGGGWEAAAGVGTFWYVCLIGLAGIVFDSTGIGRLEWSGDLNVPFSWRKSAWGYITAGWPVAIGGMVYFIDLGGLLFETDGSSADHVGHTNMQTWIKEAGPFSARLIPELTSIFPTADIRTVFDGTDHRIIVYLGPAHTGALNYPQTVAGGLVMLDFHTARFAFTTCSAVLTPPVNRQGLIWTVAATCTGNPIIETGGIQMVKPEYHTHVHYLDLDVESVSDPAGMQLLTEIRDVYEDDDAAWIQMPPIEITETGRAIVRVTINRLIDRVPQFRFTLLGAPSSTKSRIWGIERIAFQEGGLRS
jgi:hypothetical protein